MSVGAVPEQLTPPGEIVPPEELGPAAPNPAIDALLDSTPMPAQPSNGVVPDEGAWPPPVPTSNPLAEAPPALNPAGAMAQPGQPPGDLAVDVIKRQGKLNEEVAGEKSRQADELADNAIDHKADLLDAMERGNAVLEQRQKQYDDALAKYQGMHLGKYWDDKSHSKFTTGLSLAFGALGAGLRSAGGGSGRNDALDILEKKIADYTDHQKEEISKARDSVVMARTGIQDAKEAKAALMADVNARQAATLGALETKGRAKLAALGVPAAAIDTDARIVQLQEARQKAQLKADEEHKKAALTEAQIHFYNARTSKMGRVGGGKGGGGRGDALAAFTAAAVDGKTSEADLAAMGLRAGLKPNQVAAEVARIRKEKDSATGGIQRERLDEKKFAQWQQQEGVQKLITSRDQLETIKKKISAKEVDPATVATSLMEFDRAVKGGVMTQASYNALMDHLGGMRAKVQGWFEHGQTGNLGAEQIGTVRKAIDAAIAAADDEAKTKAASFDDRFGTGEDTSGKYNSVFRRFGIARGGEAKAGGPPPGAVTKFTGKNGVVRWFDASGAEVK